MNCSHNLYIQVNLSHLELICEWVLVHFSQNSLDQLYVDDSPEWQLTERMCHATGRGAQ